MKKLIVSLSIALFLSLPALAAFHGSILTGARSEISLDGLGLATEDPFINMMKEASLWNYNDNTGLPLPPELDSNGYPLSGGAWVGHGGAKNPIFVTSQAERAGDWIVSWTGGRKVSLGNNSGTSTGVSCTGSLSGTSCDGTGCSTFTASITSGNLNVTVAPTGTGCTLAAGVPISGASVKVSTMGVPTIITGTCGANCYTLNQSQTVGSETMTMGGRLRVSFSGEAWTSTAQIVVTIQAANSDVASNMALYHINDETAYFASASPCPGTSSQGCILSPQFQTRIKQANPAVLRDLDWSAENISNCTTWSSRKPAAYFSYAASEMRNAASGTETYVAGGHTYTIPKIGQYVDASGTGASGGTVSYNSGTDTYSITLGTGTPVDKQIILMLAPSTGTTSSKISLNGTTASFILSPLGIPLSSSFGAWIPQASQVTALVYDATLGGFMSYGGSSEGATGINCGVPPEVFIEANAEMKTTPWHELPSLAQDPMTDWVTQHATYQKANYSPSSKPIYSTINEPWNCAGGPYVSQYTARKSQAYIGADTNNAWVAGFACGGTGNTYGEIGKMASTDGQDLNSVYGAGNYELLVNLQTHFYDPSFAVSALQSPGYVGQSMASQTGYTKAIAYTVVTRIANDDYWSVGFVNTANEIGLGYCYYNYSISSACQGLYGTQAAAMTAYVNSSSSTLSAVAANLSNWNGAGQTCSAATRPGSCTVNQTSPLMMYEGGYSPSPITADVSQSIATASNAAQAVLTMGTNGCVAGQPIVLSSLGGGTWASADGSYIVQSATSTTCTINLNSTSLGTYGDVTATATGSTSVGGGVVQLASCTGIVANQAIYDVTTGKSIGTVRNFSSCTSGSVALLASAVNAVTTGDTIQFSAGTMTYTGSLAYVNYLRSASYLAPELDTYTTSIYNTVIANGGVNPSQYQMASPGFFNATPGSGNPWWVFAFDIYGYVPMANCTSCTISGSTLTLGGTVSGVFRVGDTLFGKGVTGLGTGAGSPTTITSCTKVGSGPCGTNASDTLGLSQASTVGTGTTMTGNATPPANQAGNSTTSPVRAWGAICRWNGNGAQCNG